MRGVIGLTLVPVTVFSEAARKAPGARADFATKNKDGYYSFDDGAFGLKRRSKGTRILFRFPHAVEVARGQTLDLSVDATAAPRCGR